MSNLKAPDSPKKLGFKAFQHVYIKDLVEGTAKLQTADFTHVANDKNGEPFFIQFDMEDTVESKKIDLKKGVFRVEYVSSTVTAIEIDAQKTELFEQASAALSIRKEVDTFFDNLDVYAKLKIDHPKRGALIHSPPGVGKSTTIAKLARDYVKETNTCVIIWPSDVVEAEDIKQFLSVTCNWDGIDRFILVIEDLGGGSDIYGAVHNRIPSSLLNFLDGLEDVFKKPTFIIATTNNPDALLDSLTSRPGRFDVVMGLPLPKANERLEFIKFFAADNYADLNLGLDEEETLVKLTEGFAAAHLKETYIRAMLTKRDILDIAKEIQVWIEKVKTTGLTKGNKKTSGMGFGIAEDED